MPGEFNSKLHQQLVDILNNQPKGAQLHVVVEQHRDDEDGVMKWWPVIVVPKARHRWPLPSEHQVIAEQFARDLLNAIDVTIRELGGKAAKL
jgi:hypothetical protein